MSEEIDKPLQVFYCYARKDREFRDELDKHLSNIKRKYHITSWSDGEISPGAEWQKEVNTQLNTAHVILLLISADFMDSAHCYNVEMKCALERHEAGSALVIPIILRHVDFEDAPFSKLQVLPTDAKPVTEWPDQDRAYYDIVQGIRRSVQYLSDSLKAKEWIDKGSRLIQKIAEGLPTTSAHLIRQLRCELHTRTIWLQFANADGRQKLPIDLIRNIEETHGWHVKVEDSGSMHTLNSLESIEEMVRERSLNEQQPKKPLCNKTSASLDKGSLERLGQQLLNVAQRLLPSGITMNRHHYQEEQSLLQIVCTPRITPEEKSQMKADFRKVVGDDYTLGITSIPKQSNFHNGNQRDLELHLLSITQRLLPSGITMNRHHYQEEQSLLQIVCTPITPEEKSQMKADFRKVVGDDYTLGITSIPKQSNFHNGSQRDLELHLLSIAQRLLPSGITMKRHHYQEEQSLLQIVCTPRITLEEKSQMKVDFRKVVGDGYTLGIADASKERKDL